MKNDITVERIANAICQDTTFNGTYILVEGINDFTFFRKFFLNDFCEIQITFGKENVARVLAELAKRNKNNSIGIVDSDFDRLEATLLEGDNIFYTDDHDLETMIIKSDAFNSICDVHCVASKLSAFRSENDHADLRDIILREIKPLGYFKWANRKHGWGLMFKPQEDGKPKLKIEEFIPSSTIKFAGISQMVRTVFNFSRGKANFIVDEHNVVQILTTFIDTEADDYQLCNGHDFAYVFSLALRKKVATKNSNSVASDDIEKDLILAYDSMSFKTTELYSKLRDWEQRFQRTLLKKEFS